MSRRWPFPSHAPGWAASLACVVLAAACGPEPRRQERPAATRAGPRLECRRERTLDGKPLWVVAEDLDGDGHADPVVALQAPGGLRVWSGGPGWGGPPRSIEVGGHPLRPLALPAVAGARRLLVVASRASGELVHVDPFAAQGPLITRRVQLPATPRALGVGDLGGDGVPDTLVAFDERRMLRLHADALEERALAGRLPRCLHVLADGSGVVVGYQDTRSLEVLDVDPELAARQIPLGGIPRAMAEADLDGDGDLELAVAGGDHSLWVFGWGAAGGARAWRDADAAPPLEWSTGTVPIDLSATDLDQDGRPELVGLAYHGLTWSVAGDFSRAGPRLCLEGYAGQTPTSLALGDLDGDRLPELFVSARDTLSLSLLAGRGARGFASAPRVAVGRFPSALAVGDLDGDGKADAVVIAAKDESACVVTAREGGLRAVATLALGRAPRAPRLADLDGDGDLDLAMLSEGAHGATVRIWLGDGRAGFGQESEIGSDALGGGARDLLPLDAAGGRVDLVVADEEGGRVLLFERLDPGGQGGARDAGGAGGAGTTGGLAYGAPLTTELCSAPRALAALSSDADGSFVVACGGDAPALSFLSRDPGGGAPPRETSRLDLDWIPLALAVADLDGDGARDLIVLLSPEPSAPRAELAAFLRRGTAHDPEWLPLMRVPTSGHPRDLAAGDLDGDGRAEVVVAAQTGHVLDLWRALPEAGGGARLDRLDGIGAGVGPMAVAIVDLDGDGRPDLLSANGHSDDLSAIYSR